MVKEVEKILSIERRLAILVGGLNQILKEESGRIVIDTLP